MFQHTAAEGALNIAFGYGFTSPAPGLHYRFSPKRPTDGIRPCSAARGLMRKGPKTREPNGGHTRHARLHSHWRPRPVGSRQGPDGLVSRLYGPIAGTNDDVA